MHVERTRSGHGRAGQSQGGDGGDCRPRLAAVCPADSGVIRPRHRDSLRWGGLQRARPDRAVDARLMRPDKCDCRENPRTAERIAACWPMPARLRIHAIRIGAGASGWRRCAAMPCGPRPYRAASSSPAAASPNIWRTRRRTGIPVRRFAVADANALLSALRGGHRHAALQAVSRETSMPSCVSRGPRGQRERRHANIPPIIAIRTA